MTWQAPYTGTWLDRPGKSMSTSRGTGKRWVLHRWSDTGETTLRFVEGDARHGEFVEHERHDLGVTSTWSMAVCAADRRRAESAP